MSQKLSIQLNDLVVTEYTGFQYICSVTRAEGYHSGGFYAKILYSTLIPNYDTVNNRCVLLHYDKGDAVYGWMLDQVNLEMTLAIQKIGLEGAKLLFI